MRAVLCDQAAPEMQQQQVVFARLDRADAQEIGAVAGFWGDVPGGW
jgi:hypothetical protein